MRVQARLEREKRDTHPLHFGACGKPRVVLYNGRPMARTYGNGSSEMRVLSTYGSRGDVEPMVGLAVELRAFGAERCDAPAAGGVVPAGVWR